MPGFIKGANYHPGLIKAYYSEVVIKISNILLGLVTITTLSLSVQASQLHAAAPQLPNVLDELNPFDPNIEQILEAYDKEHEEETGVSARAHSIEALLDFRTACKRNECAVWAMVDKSEQRLYLYVNGVFQSVWPVSTGVAGHGTPNFDTHPDGRIYDSYTSKKYPGGDFNGLGNMPYAVFISGGFAIHGTSQGNWAKLGTRASHGCVRIHPDNAFQFNRLVRSVGVGNVWVTIQE